MKLKKKYVYAVLAILWMALIFSFSAKEADESTEMSLGVGHIVGSIFVKDYDNWPEETQEDFARKIDHPVRKTAHAAEYALLGMLLMGTFCDCEIENKEEIRIYRKKQMLYSYIVGTMYAATDEFHQLFVAGRSGRFSDVMLDSAGVFAGIMIVFAFYWCKKRVKSLDKL